MIIKALLLKDGAGRCKRCKRNKKVGKKKACRNVCVCECAHMHTHVYVKERQPGEEREDSKGNEIRHRNKEMLYSFSFVK